MVEAVLKSSMGRMVTDVHKAGAGEVGDAVGERETRIERNTKIVNRGIRSFRGGISGRRVVGQVY